MTRFRFRECFFDIFLPFDETRVGEEEEKVDFAEQVFYICRRVLYLAYIGVWACAIMYTIYNVSQSLGKYLERPVRTQIQIYRTENGSMQFPTISICNMNKVNKSYMESNPVLAEFWDAVENQQNLNWTDDRYKRYENITYRDIFQYSPTWEQTRVVCTHAGVRYCKNLHYNHQQILSEDYGPTGRCFRFNPSGKIESKSGDYGQIYLRLNVNRKEYRVEDEVGFVIAIHHHTQYSVTRNTGIQLSPGFKYKIGVRTVEREELSQDLGGRCDKTRITNSYGGYDLESCNMECRDKILVDECGCLPWLPPKNIYNYKACTLKEVRDCGHMAYYNYVLSESDTHVKRYENCPCPVPCRNTIYTLQTTTTALSKEWAKKKAKKKTEKEGAKFNFTAEDILKNNVIIEIFFADMYVDKIAQIPAYDFWNLLADVGGMMGLFLGASVFTILEVATKLSQKLYKHSKRRDSSSRTSRVSTRMGSY